MLGDARSPGCARASAPAGLRSSVDAGIALGYWKATPAGEKGWQQRYDQQGRPITPQQAHPGAVRAIGRTVRGGRGE
jgi:hypothetical protein